MAPSDPAVPETALAELRDFLVASLHHHHRSEDETLWPMLQAAAPEIGAVLADLSKEHDKLAAALDELGSAPIEASTRDELGRAGAAVRTLVHAHLEREDEAMMPALERHVTDEWWDGFARQVVATSPAQANVLMVGFLDLVGTQEEVDVVLQALPDEARAMLPGLRAQARATLDALHRSL